MLIFGAVEGRQVRVPVIDPSNTTALVLTDFTVSVVEDGELLVDPTTDLQLMLDESSPSELPGYYDLIVTPREAGFLYLRLVRGPDTFEFALQVAHEAVDLIGTTQAGAEGDFEVVVKDSLTNPIEGVVVRVFDDIGTKLLARGTTDSTGQVVFSLPVGDYEVRVSKQGYSFDNPTSITVQPNANVEPVVEEILPSTASEGERVTLLGRFFGPEDAEVFFSATVVSPDVVSDDGTAIVVTVPTGLTDTVIPVRVRKPDPDNIGEYLISNSVSMVLS